jgi:hypothetical protein
MSFPVLLDSAIPANSESPSLGAARIRALTQALLDLFGIPNATNVTAAIASMGSLTDGKLATLPVGKASSPFLRLIGTEASAKDMRLVETGGVAKIQINVGTEGSPSWSDIVSINLAATSPWLAINSSGQLEWKAAANNKGILTHANTADRTYTFPDASGTLVTGTGLADGTAAAPSLAFASNAAVDGFFKAALGILGFAGRGLEIFRMTAVASAISSIEALAAAGTDPVTLQALSTSSAIGFSILAKGTGTLLLAATGLGLIVLQTNSVPRLSADATSVRLGTALPLVPGTWASGTPEQNGLYAQTVPKAYGNIGSDASINGAFNLASVSKPQTGTYRLNWTRAFSSAFYVVIATPYGTAGAGTRYLKGISLTTGYADVSLHDGSFDADGGFNFVALGTQ